MLLKEECKKCSRILFPKDLMKGTGKIEGLTQTDPANIQGYYAFRCACYQEIFPCLKVRIGDVSFSVCISYP
jgi:hypothetical protein